MKKCPNILLVISEDNGQHLSCYGDRNLQTTHLDALAADGVRFVNAYCTQGVCSPGRASIYTGLYPHQNGQIGLSTHEYAMYSAIPNLPSLLKPLGYRTGLVGKLHVKPFSAFPWDLWWNDPDYISFNYRDVHKTVEVARRFIADAGEDPFFLTVASRDCHLPFLRQCKGIPENPLDAEDVTPLPFVGVDSERIHRHTADYYNCMQRLDLTVGLLVEALRASGKEEETLIIFTTDHGAQFSRGKCTCYEGGLRIPMIIRWLDQIPAGRVVDPLVSQVDLLPTIMSAIGEEPPPHVAGSSLLPLIAGDTDGWRDFICGQWTSCHSPIYYPQRSIRDDRYKLIVTYLSDRSNPCALLNSVGLDMQKRVDTGTIPEEIEQADPQIRRTYEIYENPPAEELYDLHEDPWEFADLAEDPNHSSIKEGLRKKLESWQCDTGDLLLDPGTLSKLTAEHDDITRRYYSAERARVPEDFTWPYRSYLGVAAPTSKQNAP